MNGQMNRLWSRLVGRLRGVLGAALLAAPLLAPTPGRAATPRASDPCPAAVQAPTAEQAARLARQAVDHGVLWRLTKDGHSSYLFGTLHLGRLAWVFPGPALRDAMAETDTLALELDPLDPAVQKEMTDAMHNGAQPPLPPALAQRLARHVAAARCIDNRQALQQAPRVMQALTLGLLQARFDGYEIAFGQDLSLAGWAHAQQRPVVGLETVAEQLQALMPDEPALAEAMVRDTLEQIDNRRGRAITRRMAEAWAEGRLEELGDYAQWCDCASSPEEQALMKRLNDDRNPHLAERIDALHMQGQRVLAAVGALHMTGPFALPQLLAAKGYQVERVRFASRGAQ